PRSLCRDDGGGGNCHSRPSLALACVCVYLHRALSRTIAPQSVFFRQRLLEPALQCHCDHGPREVLCRKSAILSQREDLRAANHHRNCSCRGGPHGGATTLL